MGPISLGYGPDGKRIRRKVSHDPLLISVRDAGGGHPEGIAEFPGASGISEAVLEVGSGTYEFSGPLKAPTPP